MPTRGPAPKDPSVRQRRNKDTVPTTELKFVKGAQPKLPARFATVTLKSGATSRRRKAWPERTAAWWKMWAQAELAKTFTAADWEFLLDTALIHAAFWEGDMKQAAELRQRESQFAMTPESRARLRIQYAAADEADGRAQPARARNTPAKKDTDARRILHAVN